MSNSKTKSFIFPELSPDYLENARVPAAVDQQTLSAAQQIVDDVRADGDKGLIRLADKFGDRKPDQPLVIAKAKLTEALESIDQETLAVLRRTCERIRTFAQAQLDCLQELSFELPGGRAGHTIEPIEKVGCYAPGGRYPLPSTVLMTAVVARVAGCHSITVGTPNPNPLTLAAASIAGADRVLAVGGAQCIAGLAYGTESIEPVDLIVGPGNRWVTAAKQIVSGRVAIDMLAGPSELVIVADDTANPECVAADLLAQAEHDVDARTILVSTSEQLVDETTLQLARQLDQLTTQVTAAEALKNGGYFLVQNMDEAIEVANQLAGEHLQLNCQNAEFVARRMKHAGCVFIGNQTAEVFGDYGLGPNHTLPTGATARYRGGLSVFDFVRVRTWLNIESELPPDVKNDVARLAEIEGLDGHRKAAIVDRST